MNPFSMSGAWGRGMTVVYDHIVARGMLPIYQQMIDELLRSHPGQITSVLDVGCGSGFATAILAEKLPQAQVTGIDLSAQAVAMAINKYQHLPNLQFQVGNAQSLAFIDQQFDLVISTGSIKHWPDPALGVREMLRVLKQDGMGVMVETDPFSSISKARYFVSHWHYGFARLPRISAHYFQRYIAEQSPALAALRQWFEEGKAQIVQAQAHPAYPFNVVVAGK
jgi:ubiquinone/menaquinone biosynthesis C-methylase UbiE